MLAKAGEGASTREIAAWLKAEHGVETTHGTVHRVLDRMRSQRADIAKAVVREKLAKSVVSDLDALDVERNRLRMMSARLYRRHKQACEAAEDPESGGGFAMHQAIAGVTKSYLEVVDRIAKVVDLKLHYSGADTPDDTLSSLAEADRRVASRLDRLAQRGREGEGTTRTGSDPEGTGGS